MFPSLPSHYISRGPQEDDSLKFPSPLFLVGVVMIFGTVGLFTVAAGIGLF